MQTDLIIINDYCDRCHVDPSFIVELEEDGLINVQVIGEERYIPVSQLAELERYTHLYYDHPPHAGTDRILAAPSPFAKKRTAILPLTETAVQSSTVGGRLPFYRQGSGLSA